MRRPRHCRTDSVRNCPSPSPQPRGSPVAKHPPPPKKTLKSREIIRVRRKTSATPANTPQKSQLTMKKQKRYVPNKHKTINNDMHHKTDGQPCAAQHPFPSAIRPDRGNKVERINHQQETRDRTRTRTRTRTSLAPAPSNRHSGGQRSTSGHVTLKRRLLEPSSRHR